MDLGAKGYALVWNLHYRRGQGNFRKNNTASKGSGKLNGGGLDRLFEDTVSRLHLRDTSPRSYHGLGGCIETRLERVNVFIKPRFSTGLLIVGRSPLCPTANIYHRHLNLHHSSQLSHSTSRMRVRSSSVSILDHTVTSPLVLNTRARDVANLIPMTSPILSNCNMIQSRAAGEA